MSPAVAIILRDEASVLSRAVARWDSRVYDPNLDALPDLSGNGLHARLGSAVGADSNDPLRLQFGGMKEVYFPGSANNNVSTPNNAYVAQTGDMELEFAIRLSSISSIAIGGLFTPGSRSWGVMTSDAGVNIAFIYSVNGTDFQTLVRPHGLSVGQKGYFKVEFDVDNGVGGKTATWYRKLAPGDAWTSLGSASNTTGGTAGLFPATSPFILAAGFTGVAGGFSGYADYFKVRAGIGGVQVVNFDATQLAEPYASYTDALNSIVWTLNRSATGRKLAVIDDDEELAGTDDFDETVDSALLNFGASQDFTIAFAVRAYGTPAANSVLLAKKTNLTTAAGYALYLNTSRVPVGIIADGSTSVSATAGAAITAGVKSLVGLVRRNGVLYVWSGNAFTAGTADTTTGNLSNSEVLRAYRLSGAGASYADVCGFKRGVFRSALSADDFRRLAAEWGATA